MFIFLSRTIQDAGDLLLKKRDEGFEIMNKNGDNKNIVTSIDIAVNEYIIREIQKSFPEHSIYSEEGGGKVNTNEYMWTIDPIDGSSNFSRGIPHYAISIGLLENGIPVMGAVYNPVTKELFSFKKDEGAVLNGKRLIVSQKIDLKSASVFFHQGRKEELREWGVKSYAALQEHARKVQDFACSSLDTCFVASGRIEANIYGTLSTLDISPAVGILIEAGGLIANQYGEEIKFIAKEPQKIFVANNRAMLDQLTAIV